VPGINRWTDGRENYREFCAGRARAFEEIHHADAPGQMPAAAAVGGEGDSLCVMYAAGGAAPRPHPNPQQTPPNPYPPAPGPRPPSFARATTVSANGCDIAFISGTASIKGHATQHAGDIGGQIACTLDNLRLIAETCGADLFPAPPSSASAANPRNAANPWRRHIKIYLRRAADLPRAQALLAPAGGAGLVRPDDDVIWLRSDICRADLDIEIEATLLRRAPLRAAV
jgi:hypothetical protein